MAGWKEVLGLIAANAEEHIDALKYRLGERLGSDDPIVITPYRGYGTPERLYLKGRVLENNPVMAAGDNDSLWDNLVNMYRRFATDEIPYARVKARFQGVEQEVAADEEGFFEVEIKPVQPLPADRLWHEVELELLYPLREGHAPVRATGSVLVPPPSAEFGIISDIDDTVVHTDAANVLRMARTVFLGNARTRLPFEGAAAFYRALHGGSHGNAMNPMLYVSSSAWNIYDLLSEFFHLHDIPTGPVLFLRDWGLSRERLLDFGHRSHKLGTIRRMLELYSNLPFILIGDSGQEDPEIYYELVGLYPNRIRAVYIRNVSRDLKRPEEIRALAEEVVAAGSTLILADDTLPMAQHAAEQGWIAPSALPGIRIEKEKDQAPPGPIEALLGEEEPAEAPTVVVEGETPAATEAAIETGAIEEALKTEEPEIKKPPNVIVEGTNKA